MYDIYPFFKRDALDDDRYYTVYSSPKQPETPQMARGTSYYKTKCPGLGGTSPDSQTLGSVPNSNSKLPP